MINFFLTLAVGFVIGYVFYMMKVPGGMMVGAIVGVAIMNIIWGISYMPSYAKYGAQIVAGAFIGCTVEKSDIQRLRHLLKPALVLISALLILNISLGFLICFLSPLDLTTSLMSCIPGGMSDIPLISADMGADPPKVAVLQFVRMVIGIGLFPTLISIVARNEKRKMHLSDTDTTVAPMNRTKSGKKNITVFLQTITIALIAGSVGIMLDIPAGAMLFSMLSVICLKLFFNRSYMPMLVKRFAQILSGAYIGCYMSYDDVLELKYLLFPAILLATGYFITCLIVGKILSKHFGMSLKEAMLVATPAGASDMALISSDLGVQSTDLIVLQIIRLVVVVSLFPQIINLIVTLIN